MQHLSLRTALGVGLAVAITSLLSLTGLGAHPVPGALADSSCGALLASQANYLRAHPDTGLVVARVMSSEGYRHMNAYSRVDLRLSGTQLVSIAPNGYAQLFSDRGYPPFALAQADKISLTMDTTTGEFTVTLNTWGGARLLVPGATVHCANNVLYGFESGGWQALWTVNFEQTTAPF